MNVLETMDQFEELFNEWFDNLSDEEYTELSKEYGFYGHDEEVTERNIRYIFKQELLKTKNK